jgi:hypothetical protein
MHRLPYCRFEGERDRWSYGGEGSIEVVSCQATALGDDFTPFAYSIK